MPIVETRNDAWQADTMFYPIQGKVRAVFCAVEMNTKKGFIRAYSGASPNSKQSLIFFKELIQEHHPKFIGVDNGSEFIAKIVKSYLLGQNIELYFYDAGDSLAKAVVERFNGTIKGMLNKTAHLLDTNWIPYLHTIQNAYNSRVHRSIGKAPDDMEDSDVAEYRMAQQEKGKAYISALEQFQPGDKVRVYYFSDPTMKLHERKGLELFHKKQDPNWSKEIYTIEARVGYKLTLVGVTNMRFTPRELQKISGVDESQPVRSVQEPKETSAQKKLVTTLADLGVDADKVDNIVPDAKTITDHQYSKVQKRGAKAGWIAVFKLNYQGNDGHDFKTYNQLESMGLKELTDEYISGLDETEREKVKGYLL